MRTAQPVQLSGEQRAELEQIVRTGNAAARVQTRARILLLSSEGKSEAEIVAALHTSPATVQKTRRHFRLEGLQRALYDKPRSGRPPRITGEVQAKLAMLACSTPPQGRERWTLQLLADKMVELQYIEAISDQAVYKTLKKTNLKPWLKKKQWCIPGPPGKPNARFVAKMEDVLSVYTRPYNPKRPQVCIDEKSKELHSDVPTRQPLPLQPARAARQDYEYKREGTANIFMMTEPLTGKRWVRVTDRRTKADFAEQLRIMVDERYPDAEVVVLVVDNLNTHGPWVLYEAFPPEEADRIASRIEWHYTPEHGSWLNIAEIELSVLQLQCLNRRMPDKETLTSETEAWEHSRNETHTTVRWHFTTADARIKLRRLYPVQSQTVSI